jgi:ABC-type siderophore export system fused ATPase/permease subunit
MKVSMLLLQIERERSIRLLPKMEQRFTSVLLAIESIPVLMQAILIALAAMAYHLREDRLIGGQGSCGVVRARGQ